MKKFAFLLTLISCYLYSDCTARQNVTMCVLAYCSLDIIGPEPRLVVELYAGDGRPVHDSTRDITYQFTVNDGAVKKIIGRIDAEMPHHTRLSVDLAPPPGAYTQGVIALTTEPVDLVRNIGPNVTEGGLDLTYTLTAWPEAQATHIFVRTAIFTMIDN